MKIITYLLLLLSYIVLAVSGCSNIDNDASANAHSTTKPERIENHSGVDNLDGFSWMNRPTVFNVNNGIVYVTSEPKTDFFNDPESGKVTATAPLLYKDIEGDFVATALVKPDFSDTWNAAALMVHIDESNWIKFAFERSDATGKSIVSVVTKGVSDDANGAVLAESDSVWLRIIRKGDVYSMLWSEDGSHYTMARLTKMPASPSVKVGVEVQSPLENSAQHEIHLFNIEHRTVDNLRTGI